MQYENSSNDSPVDRLFLLFCSAPWRFKPHPPASRAFSSHLCLGFAYAAGGRGRSIVNFSSQYQMRFVSRAYWRSNLRIWFAHCHLNSHRSLDGAHFGAYNPRTLFSHAMTDPPVSPSWLDSRQPTSCRLYCVS